MSWIRSVTRVLAPRQYDDITGGGAGSRGLRRLRLILFFLMHPDKYAWWERAYMSELVSYRAAHPGTSILDPHVTAAELREEIRHMRRKERIARGWGRKLLRENRALLAERERLAISVKEEVT
jgi:hypothetical protein